MMRTLRDDCDYIVSQSIKACQPDKLVIDALKDFKRPKGRLILIAIGKAAYKMAEGAVKALPVQIDEGIVITKYGYICKEQFPNNIRVFEAGHPLTDDNSIKATDEVLKMTENLDKDDEVLFLVSGGGSALFESPKVPLDTLREITEKKLKEGADIYELNALRKELSYVKGGKFGEHCKPAHITALILSDVLGDKIDVIASGPALGDNVTHKIIGNVELLCNAAKHAAEELSYKAEIIRTDLTGYAVDVAKLLGKKALEASEEVKSDENHMGRAFIYGGETTVKVTGTGVGGRNMEMALASSLYMENMDNAAIFSLGSDGTDGPTDAAGGYVDSDTVKKLGRESIESALKNNDSYNELKKVGGLIITGPTNTNLNDVSVVLLKN
ncbi:MAG: DUF4147 domain-containing protein [Lachnospiraceae bacterium]|nr:DUF4147 domain-containing protein [Lachnospiraceae bacterium]